MALDRDLVRRIAELARLELSPAEEALFARQLGEIVAYVDQLREFETATAEGTPEPPPGAAVPEAEDAVAPGLPRASFLANAPEVAGGYLVVPRVIATDPPSIPRPSPRTAA